MAIERLLLPDKPLRPDKILSGIGYTALGYEIATKRHGVIRQLDEGRPIHLVAETPYASTDYTAFLEALLLSELELPKSYQDLITAHNAGRFRENDAQGIIDDRRKPFILPMVIGEGRQPDWAVGPLWFINKPVYYGIIRSQIQELQSEISK